MVVLNRLASIVRSATPGTGVKFRQTAYGNNGIHHFLRDVIAMANVAVDGARYIVIGVEFDSKGRRRMKSVASKDFSGKPSYQSLVRDYVEPSVRLNYQAVTIDDKRLGVFEIDDCREPPYMMRVDHSVKLRRGDAYVWRNGSSLKLGRREIQYFFEKNFRDSAAAQSVEIGFPGEIIHKNLKASTTDLDHLPSAVKRSKIKKLLETHANSKNTGATTGMLRLMHARLFGSDDLYETWTPTKLMDEMAQIETRYRDDDLHFLFEANTEKLQFVILNHGDDPIRDVSFSIVMPNHGALYVADQLPKIHRYGKYVDRGDAERAAYPTVNVKDGAIHVTNKLEKIPTGSPVNVYDVPLRICVGSDLKGRKLGIHYSLCGRNLRKPAKGKLRLLF